jgi:hypothetical protein
MPVIVVTGSFRICSEMGHRKYSGTSISSMIYNYETNNGTAQVLEILERILKNGEDAFFFFLAAVSEWSQHI